MTLGDIVFQFFRPVSYTIIGVLTAYTFKQGYPDLAKLWLAFASIATIVVCWLGIKLIFRFIFGLRHIGTLDELQMYDMSVNKSIITAVLYFDKFEADVILERMKTRMLIHLRMRSLFVKLFDQYYLKELKSDSE